MKTFKQFNEEAQYHLDEVDRMNLGLGTIAGKVGKFAISKFSGGVELNNFGYLTKKGDKYYTYVNTEVKPE